MITPNHINYTPSKLEAKGCGCVCVFQCVETKKNTFKEISIYSKVRSVKALVLVKFDPKPKTKLEQIHKSLVTRLDLFSK